MENKKITALAVQFGSTIGDINGNRTRMEELLIRSLEQRNVDIVILPEVWPCGWECSIFKESAETIENSGSINLLKKIAKKYNTNILGGSVILQKDKTLVNACPIINRSGEIVTIYEKNHLYSYYGCNEGDYITSGETPILVNLDGIKIGISICYDIRFPEIYRAYRLAGADILVNMAAWGASKKLQWDTMTASRAIENQCYFIALTQSGTLKNGEKNLGHSIIYDYKGEILSEINSGDGEIFATLDLKEMYYFRKKCTILNDIKHNYEVSTK